MIHCLTVAMTHNAPVNEITETQVISREDPIPSSCPNKERDTLRCLNFPIIAWKPRSSSRTWRICSTTASQNKIVSFANSKWEMHSPLSLLPSALKPLSKPAPSILFAILLNTSIITKNNKGDNGSPCLNPLELPKKSAGDPLTKIENCTVEIQVRIQLHHLSLKPISSTTSEAPPNSHYHKLSQYLTYKSPSESYFSICYQDTHWQWELNRGFAYLPQNYFEIQISKDWHMFNCLLIYEIDIGCQIGFDIKYFMIPYSLLHCTCFWKQAQIDFVNLSLSLSLGAHNQILVSCI